MRELIPAFIIGVIASLLAAGVVLLLKRFFLRYQKELLMQRKELEMQRELLEQQAKHIRRLAEDEPEVDKRALEATDQLLVRAATAYEAGIYDAAIIIAAAVLESRIRRVAPSEYKDRPLRQLLKVLLEDHILSPKDESDISYLWQKRNQLIHKVSEIEITESEAREYLDKANRVLLDLSYKKG